MLAAKLLTLDEHGAKLLPRSADVPLDELRIIASDLPAGRAGLRIRRNKKLNRLLGSDGLIGSLAGKTIGGNARAVRALFFNKTADTNWTLPWHQDRTICVQERRETEGFGSWTSKRGMHHVSPPFELLERMVTIRVHLDDVTQQNAPLWIALGSHRYGRVPVDKIDTVVQQCETFACHAKAGDIWLYSTPILHSSQAATDPGQRRVLQIDYSADELPSALQWLGT